MKISSPAKVNLFLHINGKKNNGYHLLESLFVFTDICDQMTFEEHNNIDLSVDGKFKDNVPTDESNIITKSIRLLQKTTKVDKGIKIKLIKNIPNGAGLGGASSNAAATLVTLNKMWNLNLSTQDLLSIAIKIGADVPSFIYKKACFVEQTGEKINPANFNLKNYHLVLASTGSNISTAKVFGEFTGKFSDSVFNKDNLNKLSKHNLSSFLENKRNDLLNSAIKFDCKIKELIEKLQNQQGCNYASMTGSGSVCFALFKNKSNAQMCLDNIKNDPLVSWCKITKIY